MFHLKKKNEIQKEIYLQTYRKKVSTTIFEEFSIFDGYLFKNTSPRVECSVSLVIAQEPNEARKLKYIIKD